MLNIITSIISLCANKIINTRESSLYLSDIKYSGSRIIDDAIYELYSLKVKNVGDRNIVGITFHNFACNKINKAFSIGAGECYSLNIMFPDGWINKHHSVYERVKYFVVLTNKKLKCFNQDLCIGEGMDKETVTAYFRNRR